MYSPAALPDGGPMPTLEKGSTGDVVKSLQTLLTNGAQGQWNVIPHGVDGDFGPKPDDSDLMWPPFRSFGRDYYTYQLLLDLKVGKEWAVRTEPHPRFYTDTTDTVPIAVPALLRTEWWPMIAFMVFKAPPEGRTPGRRRHNPAGRG